MTKRLTAFLFVAGTCAFAQPGQRGQIRHPAMQTDDRPKCRIEVVVDDVAEVVIRGDTAELRTLSGQPAEWRRFICSQIMPMNPVGFRFRGIDGRGRQTLVRAPEGGRPAVIRIEDPDSGREGYTFDIEWRGDAGGGYMDDRGPRRDRDDQGRVPGGWTGARGGELRFHGDGRGLLDRRNGRDERVRDVMVNVGRDGHVALEFEVQGFRRLVFGGQATRIAPDTVEAELTSGGGDRDTRGFVTIRVGRRGEVQRVLMKGRVNGDPFTLDWAAE